MIKKNVKHQKLVFHLLGKSIISVWMLGNDFQDKWVKRHWFCRWRYWGSAKSSLLEKPPRVVCHPQKLCVYPRSRVWFPIWVIRGNVLNLELETVFNQNKSWSLEHMKTGLSHLRISARICLVLPMNQSSILMLRLLDWITKERGKKYIPVI